MRMDPPCLFSLVARGDRDLGRGLGWLLSISKSWYCLSMDTEGDTPTRRKPTLMQVIAMAMEQRRKVPARERAWDLSVGAVVAFIVHLAFTGQLTSLF